MARSKKLSELQAAVLTGKADMRGALKDVKTRQKIADALVAKAHSEGRTNYKRDSAMRLLQRYVNVKGGKQHRDILKSPQGREIAALAVEHSKPENIKFSSGVVQVEAEYTFGTDDGRGVRAVALPVSDDGMRQIIIGDGLANVAQQIASQHFGDGAVTVSNVQGAKIIR